MTNQPGRHAPGHNDPPAAPTGRSLDALANAPARWVEQPAAYQERPRVVVHAPRLTGPEAFWYVLGCIPAGAMYFAKVPAKKALEECGMVTMTAAEKFWYILMCIAFGAGYFAKLPVKKALTESSALAPR